LINKRISTFIRVIVILLFLAPVVLGQLPTPILPDPKLTPGDAFNVTADDLCKTIDGVASSGCSHPAELRAATASVILRRRKADVLELPRKEIVRLEVPLIGENRSDSGTGQTKIAACWTRCLVSTLNTWLRASRS
jgi:hypothetical protein